MLAKAVAHHTTAAFIRVVGSEFVQKYLGEGPRLVRDVFRLAKENAPAIIFIDEVDAIATARFDAQTGALLGAHMIGAEVTELIQGYVVGRQLETTEEDLMLTVFPHPTLSETVNFAAEMFEGTITDLMPPKKKKK